MLASTLSDGEWSPVELWLDLRGTAITPRMALSKLEEDSIIPFSKVIVSIQDAERSAQESNDFEILVVDENDSSLCDAKDPSIRYGTVVTIDGDSFVDPMPALETTTRGGWVLVMDAERGSDKTTERHEAISSLVDFISGGMSLDSFSLGEDDSSGDDEQGSPFNNEKGGIAITCKTKADLVQAANTVHSVSSGTLTTTESGILIKSNPVEGATSGSKPLQSALVLPFDLTLWKQAASIVMTDVS